MSMQAMTWAYEQRTGDVGAKAILVAIANYYNPNEEGSFVGHDRLARDTDQSVATVKRKIAKLVDLKLITVRQRSGGRAGRQVNVYTLPMAQQVSYGSEADQVPTAQPESSYSSNDGFLELNCELHTQEPIEPKKNARDDLGNVLPFEASSKINKRKDEADRQTEFDHWYETYPKHVAPGAARKAYAAAIKKTDAATLLAGAERMAAQYPDRTQKGLKYCAMPSTWLNQERWADEVSTVSAADQAWAEEW